MKGALLRNMIFTLHVVEAGRKSIIRKICMVTEWMECVYWKTTRKENSSN